MNFTSLFEMQGMLFSIMILGLLIKKHGIIKEQSQDLLTDLVIYVTLPCSIIRSFEMDFNHGILVNCLVILLVAVGIQVGSYLLSFILYPGMDETRKKVLQYATICSNAGILGNPIAESIFGSLGLLYASIYLIPQRIFMWSAGLTYFTTAPDRKTLIKKVMTHPCILAVAIGMVMMVTGVRLPPVAEQTVKTLASANTALSMLFIGSILAGVRFGALWNRVTIYYSLIRLAFIPFLIYLCCLGFQVEPVVTGVSVVLSGMPAASVTAILAAKYKCDAVFAAKNVVSSTLLSMITIPAWCLLLHSHMIGKII